MASVVAARPTVTLRPWEPADARALAEAVQESFAELHPWMLWCEPGFDEREALAFIRKCASARTEGRAYQFAILDASSVLCGACGLDGVDAVNRRANLGYWIRDSRAGRGLATAAVLALRDWGFSKTRLVRFEIMIGVENAASVRVAEKAGASREGLLRRRLLIHGVEHDAVLYSFVKP